MCELGTALESKIGHTYGVQEFEKQATMIQGGLKLPCLTTQRNW